MSEATDKFIVATYAIWAGDFHHAEDLLEECKELLRPRGAEASPDDVISKIAASRLRQLHLRRAEFKRLAADYQEPSRPLSGE
jgi:hypothetical protein